MSRIVLNFADKYDLAIRVKSDDTSKVRDILIDNGINSMTEKSIFNKWADISIYSVTLNKIEVVRKLLKQANIKYY